MVGMTGTHVGGWWRDRINTTVRLQCGNSTSHNGGEITTLFSRASYMGDYGTANTIQLTVQGQVRILDIHLTSYHHPPITSEKKFMRTSHSLLKDRNMMFMSDWGRPHFLYMHAHGEDGIINSMPHTCHMWLDTCMHEYMHFAYHMPHIHRSDITHHTACQVHVTWLTRSLLHTCML